MTIDGMICTCNCNIKNNNLRKPLWQRWNTMRKNNEDWKRLWKANPSEQESKRHHSKVLVPSAKHPCTSTHWAIKGSRSTYFKLIPDSATCKIWPGFVYPHIQGRKEKQVWRVILRRQNGTRALRRSGYTTKSWNSPPCLSCIGGVIERETKVRIKYKDAQKDEFKIRTCDLLVAGE